MRKPSREPTKREIEEAQSGKKSMAGVGVFIILGTTVGIFSGSFEDFETVIVGYLIGSFIILVAGSGSPYEDARDLVARKEKNKKKKEEKKKSKEVRDDALRELLGDKPKNKPTKAQKSHTLSRRNHIPSHVRRAVWQRDGGHCVRCGSTQNIEFDHVIPVSKGGSSTTQNIELLCQRCNRIKSDKIE